MYHERQIIKYVKVITTQGYDIKVRIGYVALSFLRPEWLVDKGMKMERYYENFKIDGMLGSQHFSLPLIFIPFEVTLFKLTINTLAYLSHSRRF